MKESSTDIEEYYEFPIFLSYIVKNGRAVFILRRPREDLFKRADDLEIRYTGKRSIYLAWVILHIPFYMKDFFVIKDGGLFIPLQFCSFCEMFKS